MLLGRFDPQAMQRALTDYAGMLQPWAESVAGYMLADTARRNATQWKQHSRAIGAGLRAELFGAPTGAITQQLLGEQVMLIKSLPLEAAERVQQIVLNNMPTGQRFESLIPKILETGDITEARARLIARTETSKAAATFTQARAQSVGSEGYIWRTVGDSDVRPSHKEMEGRYVRWSTPPTLDKMTGHAGCLPNCRCFAEVILPGE